MNCEQLIERDPRSLVSYAIDVINGAVASDAAVHGNEFTHAAAVGASRFLEIVRENMNALDSTNSTHDRLIACEESSLDIGQGIGLITSIIGDFTVSGDIGSASLEAARVLLMLAKIQVDEGTHRLMAEENASRVNADIGADFMAGVELARTMMAADKLAPGAAEIEAQNRHGEQADFARPFLTAILHRPELLPGFSAVVSFVFGTEQTFHDHHIPTSYEAITGVTTQAKRKTTAGKKAVAA